MTTRILVPLQTWPDGNSEGLAHHARAVARHLNAALHALVLDLQVPKVSSPLGRLLSDVPTILADARQRSRTHGAALLDAIRAEAEAAGTPFTSTEIQCIQARFGEEIATEARYHDLTLAGLVPGDGELLAAAEAAIFGSGRPALLVPEKEPAGRYDHVAIAWDGSRVAARAVGDAREFLKKATSVSIITVVGEKKLEGVNAPRLADLLTFHGVKADVVEVQNDGGSIGDSLQRHAIERGAGLLVMGGFGHSRMRDFVLGGATNGILRNLRLPILMSH